MIYSKRGLYPASRFINNPSGMDYDTSDYFLFSTTNDFIPVRNDIKRRVITRKKQAEQSAKQPAEKIGCLQDKSAGSESRLRRGAVTEQSIK